MTLSWRRIQKCYLKLKPKNTGEISRKEPWKFKKMKQIFQRKCLLRGIASADTERVHNLKTLRRLDDLMKQILAILINFLKSWTQTWKKINKKTDHPRFSLNIKILRFVCFCLKVVEQKAWEKTLLSFFMIYKFKISLQRFVCFLWSWKSNSSSLKFREEREKPKLQV